MSDSFTEVTHESWGSRIKGAFAGIIFGIILIVGGIVLLSWNEGRTIKTKRSLKEGASLVVSVPSGQLDVANDDTLVHVHGMLSTQDVLTDKDFKVSATAIHLYRNVEMYQWVEDSKSETVKKVGGGTETKTTYSYTKKWSSSRYNSSEFKKPEGHTNPSDFLFNSANYSASDVLLGEFKLNSTFIGKVGGRESLSINKGVVPQMSNTTVDEQTIYIGSGSKTEPKVGDLKVDFQVVYPKEVSVIGRQHQGVLVPYTTSNGKNIAELDYGVVPADVMFDNALHSNKAMGYLLRLVGLLLLMIGWGMIFKPLVVLADVLPFLGSIVGVGTGIVSFVLGLSFGLVTIAVAWIAYRPLVAIPLLVGAVALIVLLIIRARKSKATAVN